MKQSIANLFKEKKNTWLKQRAEPLLFFKRPPCVALLRGPGAPHKKRKKKFSINQYKKINANYFGGAAQKFSINKRKLMQTTLAAQPIRPQRI